MAFAWGMQFTDAPPAPFTLEQLRGAGYLLSFLYLLLRRDAPGPF